MPEPLKTALYDFHLANGGRMVEFAGYSLPVQYTRGVIAEHLQTRKQSSLFDIGHMGQILARPSIGDVQDLAACLERLFPSNFQGLSPYRQRYSFLTTESGGILDDMMVTRLPDCFLIDANASRKSTDFQHLTRYLGNVASFDMADRAFLAIQGPASEKALSQLIPSAEAMRFMDVVVVEHDSSELCISRSGYTGEDGFEVSLPNGAAEDFARSLVETGLVKPAGLGARDSLRLEAGLCLYGNDIDESTSPVEAGIHWAIGLNRRVTAPGSISFLGAERILRELKEGACRRRVGIRPLGRAPMRHGTVLFADSEGQKRIGVITSGGYGPSVRGPVAMGYVDVNILDDGGEIYGEVRGKYLPAEIVRLPFVRPNFKKS